MQIANQPAIVHITHDVFHGSKCQLGIRFIGHGQPDAGQQLIDQHQHRQRAKEIPEVKILGCVILRQVLVPHLGCRKTLIYPFHRTHEAPPSLPIRMVVSDK